LKPRAKKPRGKPFVAGDARINRAGVPKESVEFQAALRVAFAKELNKPYRLSLDTDGKPLDPKKPVSNFQQIIRRVVELATCGAEWAIEMAFERIGGKVVQPTTIGTDSDKTIGFIFDVPRPERERQTVN
jgi:hypothetical protein